MTHKVEFQNWDYTCGDGCCYEWGTRLLVDGKVVTENFDLHNLEVSIPLLLEALGVPATVEEID